ncbi:hypothetical protein EP56_01635 [Listeriaceae bacterium FSL A5-0209]|nr:hypothetical protein EP56_01635 [Listeriaceae bacterium FSL A5-0209]
MLTLLKHEFAFPKHFVMEQAITATEAKKLYPHKVQSNKDFVCATPNCDAPLTCKSIDTISTSSFVEGRRSENLHADHCLFSTREIQKTERIPQEQQYQITNTGNQVDHTVGLYFAPIMERSEENPPKLNTTDEAENTAETVTQTQKGDPTEKRANNNRLTKLHQFVTAFEDNPDSVYINKQNVQLPIRGRFRHINAFKMPLPLDDRFVIVYGKAFLHTIRHPTCYQVRFKDAILVNERLVQPTFLIPKDWVELTYPFLIQRMEKNSPFNAYIRKFPETTDAMFINFKFKEEPASKKQKIITPEELLKGNTFFTSISESVLPE